ncbi:hypothetical protein KO505_14470 [Psychrosphaera sp. F3M07]|uniref:hypothetical protein n=1 Tax=Psychrosphaera sp. F3M07 TaxID=2841560 RepID=UPI001C0A0177|nr:hypothetical protein [Psychrosphaera sp. F3M07]MBU2919148.1 hypothetical protein [Psychrosphaera sp. F3M07]
MMKKTEVQIVTPLERFWHEQNQKLIANPGFLNSFGNLYDDTLYFLKGDSYKTALDFSVFDLEHIRIEGIAKLKLDGATYDLTLKEYAKLVVINNITLQNVRSAINTYSMMINICAFLNNDNSEALCAENIEAFHVSFLTQSVTPKGWFTRLSPASFNSTYNSFNFVDVRNTLHALGVYGGIAQQLTNRQVLATLDTACRSIMGVSRSEYAKGGSFNALTLEMGQYYADHLKRVYEKNYLFSFVSQCAIHRLDEHIGFKDGSKPCKVIAETILGTFTPSVSKNHKPNKDDNIHKYFKSALLSEYKKSFDKVESLKEEHISEVVRELGLQLRFDSVEVVRVLMLQRYYDFGALKSPDAVWLGYLQSIDKTEVESENLQNSTADDVYEKMSIVIKKHKLTNAAFFSSLNKWAQGLVVENKCVTYINIKSALNRVNDAMTTLMVAYLGYRKSEFGFPLSAINVEHNVDILDSAHVPFRFKLKWFVPKTNGTTKINREITSQCYQLAAQLNEVHQAPDGAPCLYADVRSTVSTSDKSGLYIDLKVKSNWANFVAYYQPFVDANELQRISGLPHATLSCSEKDKLVQLSEQYDLNSARVQHLLAASKEVRAAFKRLQCTTFCGDKGQKRFKASLIEYQNIGIITNKNHLDVVNRYLSDETRQWLRSGQANLDKKSMLDITSELTSDVRYPTPHAFRHIWAESVLVRYQGDVGAVISHQFCHLDNSFFMAYLRDKEVKHLMQSARMRILNNIVDILLREPQKIGDEFVGGFSRFVKKVVRHTQVVTDDDMQSLRNRIVGRVISIQPSRFATCLPREGGEARAKCAELGDINPQNAKPEFCLGCTNAIITTGNIRGIWATVQPFVKECLNEDIMGFMIESHLPMLRSAHKRIQELTHIGHQDSVDKVLSFIEKAITSIENKVITEKGLYE